MNKDESIAKFIKLKETARSLLSQSSESQNFNKWYRDTEIAIERVFGKDSRHKEDFLNVSFSLSVFMTSTPDSEFEKVHYDGIKTSITLMDSFIDEIEEYWDKETNLEKTNISSEENVKLIIKRFHQVARQLQARYSNRDTLEIEDEYDVQDLFHALLKLYFDDIRPEEYTPSYAGSASRVDFLLKQEKIIIEIKKTRKGLKAKEIGEQLLIDTQRYQVHPDCNQLICFVYDPGGRIANPRGIENDLTKEFNGVPVSVYITPE